MRCFVNISFEGRCLNGVATVFANDPDHAAELLNVELEKEGLPAKAVAEHFEEIDPSCAKAHILHNGDY